MTQLTVTEARALRKAVNDVTAQLRTAALPQPEVTEDGFKCPDCGEVSGEIISVDDAERWTRGTVDPEVQTVGFYYDGGEFDGLHYQTVCCDLPVDLPDGWEER